MQKDVCRNRLARGDRRVTAPRPENKTHPEPLQRKLCGSGQWHTNRTPTRLNAQATCTVEPPWPRKRKSSQSETSGGLAGCCQGHPFWASGPRSNHRKTSGPGRDIQQNKDHYLQEHGGCEKEGHTENPPRAAGVQNQPKVGGTRKRHGEVFSFSY